MLDRRYGCDFIKFYISFNFLFLYVKFVVINFMSSAYPQRQSFFTFNSNFQNNQTTEEPKRKVLAEINPNIMNTNFQNCEKEQMFFEPPTKRKFQGFQFVPNNDDLFDSPQYTPQNNFTEVDDWPDFI